MGVKLGLSHSGRNIGWECSRAGCWERYLGRYKGSGEDYIMRSFKICTPHQIIFGWSNQEEWDGRGMWQVWGTDKAHTWKDKIKIDLEEWRWGDMDWIALAQDRVKCLWKW